MAVAVDGIEEDAVGSEVNADHVLSTPVGSNNRGDEGNQDQDRQNEQWDTPFILQNAEIPLHPVLTFRTVLLRLPLPTPRRPRGDRGDIAAVLLVLVDAVQFS